MPQVASYGDQHDLVKGQEAWLVWEGKEGNLSGQRPGK